MRQKLANDSLLPQLVHGPPFVVQVVVDASTSPAL
jgi:hypothetical protein